MATSKNLSNIRANNTLRIKLGILLWNCNGVLDGAHRDAQWDRRILYAVGQAFQPDIPKSQAGKPDLHLRNPF